MFDALRLHLCGIWNVSFFPPCNFKLYFHSSAEWNVIFKNSARNVAFKKFFEVTLLSFWQPSLMSLLYFITSGNHFHRKNYFERRSGNAKFLSCEKGTFQPYLHVWLCILNIKGRTQHKPAESLDFSKAAFLIFFLRGKCRKSWSATQGLWIESLLADPIWPFSNPLPWLCSQWRHKHSLGSGGRCSHQIFHIFSNPQRRCDHVRGAGNGWEWKSLPLDQSKMPWGWRIPTCSHQAWLAGKKPWKRPL